MEIDLLIKGLIVGALIALPVGPVGALSIRRVLSYGRMAGLVSAIGGSLADVVYAVIVRLGLTGISTTLIHHRPLFRLAGFLLVGTLGARFLLSGHLINSSDDDRVRYDGIFTSAFLLSVMNPTILFSLTIIFASVGLDRQSSDRFAPAFVVVAIFTGSVACWTLLTAIIDRFRQVMTPSNLDLLGRMIGAVIILLGVLALLKP